MCANYEPVEPECLPVFSGFPQADFDYKSEIYKDYLALILRMNGPSRSTDAVTFGMIRAGKSCPA